MQTQTYALGQEVQYKGITYLIVRIVDSIAIFENEGGIVKVKESYVQLRAWNGDFDFITLNEEEANFNCTSSIKALPPIPWRLKNVKPESDI